jgi:hypothetical protein
MMKFFWQTAILLVCLQTPPRWAVPSGATGQPGALNVTTIEFPDLKDDKRGGRRVPIKVHLPQQPGAPFQNSYLKSTILSQQYPK